MSTTIEINQQKNSSKHPPGLYLLFFTEMWERFSYYGMRGILILYLTTAVVNGGLGYEAAIASTIYGFYTMSCYLTPVLGGYITDTFMNKRLAITIGGITMAIGNLVLFFDQAHSGFWIGIALLIIGNGFFKPNISTLVGELYEENDKRRDSAFTIFYMGINIGAFFAPLICGFLAEDLFKTNIDGVISYGFKYGFLAAAIGMLIGQLLFNLLGDRYLGDIGKTRTNQKVDTQQIDKKVPLTKQEKQRTWVILILAGFVMFFWMGFEQAGNSLSIYTRDFVDRSVNGWEVPVSWFQSLNPLFIVLLAPVMSLLWVKLANSKRGDLSIPVKMGLGMILLGTGFMVLVLAVMQTGSDPANNVIKAHYIFMVGTYFLHTLGELCLSPVGLSMVTKLAPIKYASVLMGAWLASTGVANFLAGLLSAYTNTLGFFHIFLLIGGLAILLGIILILISKKLVKMMEV
ncbi:peptide MFS transporter [Priestia taiwanensis]|uniref:MFS transporter n=1 Tax=Priestia taiwanensis TaxID=1347902 RepID=A0A917AUG0_9BACI|nr:peptide MFS transporter [Priestia taiwanensis]MBM7364332.1 POT family proton-dependent oligopeptide transporter [Priestia taiwanensis]GGE73545.1 MFS transporter [Priestia taiwanensis]